MTAYRDPTVTTCPRCADAALSSERTLAIVHHRCAGCHGMWFDRAALDDLATELSVGIDTRIGEPLAEAAGLACPRCGAAMVRRQVRALAADAVAVDLDICEEHGIWFDRTEFEAVLEALMAAEDKRRSPWDRTDRPWWARAVQGLLAALDSWPGR